MKLYTCPSCANTVFSHNLGCGNCGAQLAYDPKENALVAAAGTCSNRDGIGCNWTEDAADEHLCRSCQMTDVIPDLAIDVNKERWAEGETAKRWVLATLARWGWFVSDDPGPLPVFHFKAERTRRGKTRVTMGHANGVITLNVAEADDAIRVRNREMLDEDYRTMVGHVRHELAHFIFDRLSEEPGFSDAFRALFGDERADYGAALQRHYSDGPPAGWDQVHITPYASAHPHEDWAETAAHMMHLADMVDSAVAVGMTWPSAYPVPEDAYATTDSDALIHVAVDLGIATNQLNRAMGLNDLYPFVLSEGVRDKLEFVHYWLNRTARW